MTEKPFEHLVFLYKQMEAAWEKVAKAYHFQCNGCEENCCTSLFFHHTHIEQAYLRLGFHQLDASQKKLLLHRAKTYCQKTFPPGTETSGAEIKSMKIMCPVNENGRCLLYRYRPMICRLHGLPHELCRPGFTPVMSPGCEAGEFGDKPYIKFDRTPFYQEMAQIEMAFRQKENKTGRLKKTVAQILVSQ